MTRHIARTAVAVFALTAGFGAWISAQGAADHVMLGPQDIKWQPAPPVLPSGAEIAVLDGDPSKAGRSFVIRLKFPDRYRIAPHWHPTDENIAVIQGTFRLGMGDTSAETAMHALSAGSFAKMPREVRHFAMTRGETIIQIHGSGPFAINYVNPSDDPSRKTSTSK